MSSSPLEELHQSSPSFEGELKSTVDMILQACPRFRILVLGRSGVGKSHLINTVFGIDDTVKFSSVVEHGRKAGVSDIEREITSERNPRLILHDSQGFSHGDSGNIEAVQSFIKKRVKMVDLKDRLHAIWLCIEVPAYGGSLLEVGEEKILQLKNRGVPIIAVFTKYDVLVENVTPQDTPVANDDLWGDIEADVDNLDDNDVHDDGSTTQVQQSPINASYLALANEKLRNEMIKPFEKTLDVPWVAVSVRPNYSSTLDELVKTTMTCIDQQVWLTWDRQAQILGRIMALDIQGKSLAKWLKMVHRDIVRVWGLHDPDRVLSGAAAVISGLQEGLVEGDGGRVWKMSYGAVTGAAAIVSAVVPLAAPIALPVAAGIVFAAWVYKAVKITPTILQGIMGYIVDLTIVLQSLFLLMQARMQAFGSASPVTQALFKLALRAYEQDTQQSPLKVHDEIRTFATRVNALLRHGEVIKEVERLIQSHRFRPSEVFMREARENTASSS